MKRVRVKVCCIASEREAEQAIAAGADALGLVSAMPSGPGVIADALIAQIARTVPPSVATFLLTRRTAPDAIIEQLAAVGTDTVQLCAPTSGQTRRAVKAALPKVRVVQVVHVGATATAVADAREAAEGSDAVLLDSGRPDAPQPKLGGTGRTHDWATSAAIVRAATVPVYLAGGLRPENVARAIATVCPFGVDLCSGIRSEGALDPARLDAFIKAVRGRPTAG